MHVGDVLLGTPHLIPSNLQRRAHQVRSLLKASGKLRRSQTDQAASELVLLAAISGRFEQASVKTRVLNVYEAKHTRLKWGPFSKKDILVDRDFAEVGLPNELLIGAEIDHAASNGMTADPGVRRELTAMLTEIVNNPPMLENSSGQPEDSDEEVSHAPWSSVYGDELQAVSPYTSSGQAVPAQDADGLPPARGIFERRQPRLPCYVLEPHVRNPDFVGRDDMIRTLADVLVGSSDGNSKSSAEKLQAIAIIGMGGIGKTSLAVELAFRFQGCFDAMFLVQADSEDSLAQDFARIAFRLGLVNQADAANSVVGRNVLMQWLNNPMKAVPAGDDPQKSADRAKWLLVFDNADELHVLEDYWPVDGTGAVIVTGRNPGADRTWFYSIRSLKVNQMTVDDATSMLFRITDFANTSQSHAEACRLASRLDGLPLALQQVSSYVRRSDLNFAEALNLLDDETTARGIHALAERSGHTLATVWASQAMDKPSNDLLQVLAFLDPDAIPEFIFKPSRPVWREHDNSFHSKGSLYIHARTTLHRYSLVKRNRELDQLSIHRLVQDASRLEMNEDTSQLMFELTVRLVRQAWPTQEEDYMHDPTLWPQQEQMTRQVSSVHNTFEKHPHWRIGGEARVKLAEVLTRCSWYHQERGNFDMAKRMLELPLSISSARPDPTTSLLADIYFQKAWTAAEVMDGDICLEYALKHSDTRLALEKTTKPALTQSAAMAYSILALAYLFFERFADVAPLIRDGLEIYHNAPETDMNVHWPHFFIIHHSWALIGLGKANEAVEMLEETIAWGAKRFRKTRQPSFKHGYALQALGSVRFLQGDYDECFKLNREAIRFYQETVGTNIHHVGDAYTKLAECKVQQSQPEPALRSIKAAIKVYSLYTYYNAQLARALFIQGKIQDRLKDHSEAERSRRRATDLYLEITQRGPNECQDLNIEHFSTIVPVWAR